MYFKIILKCIILLLIHDTYYILYLSCKYGFLQCTFIFLILQREVIYKSNPTGSNFNLFSECKHVLLQTPKN